MNMRIIVLSLALTLVAAPLWAAPINEYKCWVALPNGNDAIVFAEGTTMEQARARLNETPAMSRYDKRVAVATIHECADLNGRFREARARALDDITPR